MGECQWGKRRVGNDICGGLKSGGMGPIGTLAEVGEVLRWRVFGDATD